MKKIILFILIFVVTGCAQSLKVYWEYPADLAAIDSIYFDVFVWQGDSAGIPLYDDSQLDSLTRIYYSPTQTIYTHRHFFNPQAVIRAAIRTQDRLGRGPVELSLTKFYGMPGLPKELKITK